MTRAIDLPNEARAFLDAIAIGESGGKDDDAAYSVLFGGSHFDITSGWPTAFPQWAGVWIGGVPTHAAGRYQDEPATWRGLGSGSFDPESQDHKNWLLACQAVRGLQTKLQNNDIADIGDRLRSTWSSASSVTFPERYHACLAAITS